MYMPPQVLGDLVNSWMVVESKVLEISLCTPASDT